jgi:putative spermidine/putrescine transport system permease protein
MMRAALRSTFLISVYVFLLAPVLIVVVASFNVDSSMTFPPSGFTTRWYRLIKPEFFDALGVSLLVASSTSLFSMFFGVPAAIALSRTQFPGRAVLNALCMSPLMVPALVTGVALYQFSVVLWDLTGRGISGTLLGLIVGHLTFGIPFVVRAVIAGHTRYDRALEEAAQNLGASPLRTFWTVTLPVLRPSIISGAVFAFLTSLDDVPIALFMSGSDSATLPIKILTTIEYDLGGDVMAISALIVLGSFAVMLLLDRVIGLEQVLGSRH